MTNTDLENADWCDCMGEDEQWSHTKDEHKYDCYTPPPCGGCMRCLVMQASYYRMLEEEENERRSNS